MWAIPPVGVRPSGTRDERAPGPGGWDRTLEGRLFAPVGLDIGAEGPGPIALAILSEVTAVFARRSGGHLRDRKGRVHEEQAPEVLASAVIDVDWSPAHWSCAPSGG